MDKSVFRNATAILSVVFIVGMFAPTVSFAVNPDEVLSDSLLEKRARDLSTKLRCLVCQNQSIDDSDASLAKDLRVLLRKRLVAGDSDDQVIDYIVSRYGEFVLLQPRFGTKTLLLWSLPAILILLGFFVAFYKHKTRNKINAANLTRDEQERITQLLGKGD